MMIYLHIPFCESKCPYCAFNSFAAQNHRAEEYAQAVMQQLEADLVRFALRSVESVYIGGGTPSVLEASFYEPFLDRIRGLLSRDAEVTIEANPASISASWLAAIRAMGVNRISLGVQSFEDTKLAKLGRKHSGQEAIEALKLARSAGFGAINCDLIYGVADDRIETLKTDLHTARAAGASHISAYMLTLEPDTPFMARGEMVCEDEALFRAFGDAIEEAGFPRYEVAAFGVRPSEHNCGYWAGKSYLGIGAGATGTVGRLRYEPPKAIESYLADPTGYDETVLDDGQWQMERVMLGLRCTQGIDPHWLDAAQKTRAKHLIDQKRLTTKGGRLYNPDYLIADAITLYILEGL